MSHPFRSSFYTKKAKQGFTLIELLIILVIVSTLASLAIFSVTSARGKARDAERKSDLKEISDALETYYNDRACYPSTDFTEDCRGTSFQPYLKEIPCDPETGEPYDYVPLENSCRGYRLYANLKNEDDPQIEQLQCNTASGCGYGLGYNYGVAVGTTVYNPDVQP